MDTEFIKTASPIIDSTTIRSLGVVVVILQIAYLISRQFLDRNTPRKLRVLFIWHIFNGLIHFCFEGSFLYNCFFISAPLTTSQAVPDNNFRGLSPLITNFLSKIFPTIFSFPANPEEHVFGARYGTGPTSLLWQEYAKADSRWGGADLTVISLELLTVVIGGPLSFWCAYCIGQRRLDAGFWMTVLGVAELYGGFMTFAPEWLTGNVNLDTSNYLYFWVYLMFFNLLWVVFPFMSIYVFYNDVINAFKMRRAVYAASDKARADRVTKETLAGMKTVASTKAASNTPTLASKEKTKKKK